VVLAATHIDTHMAVMEAAATPHPPSDALLLFGAKILAKITSRRVGGGGGGDGGNDDDVLHDDCDTRHHFNQENIDTFIVRGGVHLLSALLERNCDHPPPAHAPTNTAAITKEAARALGNMAATDTGRSYLRDPPIHLSLASRLADWFELPVDDHRHLLALRLQR
jgi:hypothetical protein